MPRIETRVLELKARTIRKTRTSVGSSKINAHKAHVQRETNERHEYHYSGGITRCSRCPPDRTGMPARFCEDCARINKARHQAGLIRPSGDQRSSPDNIINPLVIGKYRGPGFHRRYKDSAQPVVTAFVEKFGGGWRRGVATLNGVRVHVGPKVRSVEEAFAFANQSMKLIKLGLQFEAELADKYGEL